MKAQSLAVLFGESIQRVGMDELEWLKIGRRVKAEATRFALVGVDVDAVTYNIGVFIFKASVRRIFLQ